MQITRSSHGAQQLTFHQSVKPLTPFAPPHEPVEAEFCLCLCDEETWARHRLTARRWVAHRSHAHPWQSPGPFPHSNIHDMRGTPHSWQLLIQLYWKGRGLGGRLGLGRGGVGWEVRMLSLSSDFWDSPRRRQDGWAGRRGVSRSQVSEAGVGLTAEVESQSPENLPVSVLQ